MGEFNLEEMEEYCNNMPINFLEFWDPSDINGSFQLIMGEIMIDLLEFMKFNEGEYRYREYHQMWVISKYAFFIHELVKLEKYEYCAEIRDEVYTILNRVTRITKRDFTSIMEQSIEAYRINDENMRDAGIKND